MKILNRLLNLKKKYSLIRGDKDSKYIFTFHEKSLGAELNLFGYRSNVDEKIINLKDDMAQIKIGDCELWVQNELFKLGELSYIYNEIFTPFNDNPHAYVTDDLCIEKGDYVIDAGACEGFFIKYALQRGAKVFAFEPLKALVKGLNITYRNEIEKNKVKIVNKGLSDKEGFLNFDQGKDFICEAKMNQHGSIVCEITSLDQMAKIGIPPQIDFLKMDVEDSEILVIRGAKDIIKKYKPKISIAVYHDYENASIIRDLLFKYRPDYNIVFGGCYTFLKPYRPFMLYAW